MNTNDMKRASLQYEQEYVSVQHVYASWTWSKWDTTIGLCHHLLERSVNKINRIFGASFIQDSSISLKTKLHLNTVHLLQMALQTVFSPISV